MARHPNPWARIALATGALLLFAVGCGGTDTEAADEPDPTAQDTANTSDDSSDAANTSNDSEDDGGGTDESGGADAEDPDTGDDAEDPSNMSAAEIIELLFPTFDESNQAEMQAQWEQEERERQTQVAECMREQGFEYQPVDYSALNSFDPFGDLDYNSREFAETYGFGWTTMDDFYEEEPAQEWVDPNDEYIQSLSQGAQDAYFLALYGEQPEFDETMTEEEMNALFEDNPEMFQPQGCEGEAWEETNQFAAMDQVWMELGDEMQQVYEQAQADPRMIDLQADWAECMAGKGHAFTTMEDLYMALEERTNELWDFGDFAWPEQLSDEEMSEMSDEEIDAYYSPPEPDPELQAEIQDWEIALAVDNFDCGGMDQDDTAIEIFEEYQATFVEENLDAIRTALAE